MFVEMALLLWCFDILPAMDNSGKHLLPDAMEFVGEALVVYITTFSYVVSESLHRRF